MFKWQEEIDHLGIPADKVLRLHQSQNEIQVALPGVPSQEATAYACAFNVKSGLRVTIALHLKNSHRVAFFFHRNADTTQPAKDLLNDAINYAESMGFSLADTDYHLLNESQREKLWETLPLSEGDQEEGLDVLEELEDLPEEPPEEMEETLEAVEEEIEAVEEEIESIEEEVEDDIEEIEITLEEESSPEIITPEETSVVVKTNEEQLSITTEAPHEVTPIEHFGRFLSSF